MASDMKGRRYFVSSGRLFRSTPTSDEMLRDGRWFPCRLPVDFLAAYGGGDEWTEVGEQQAVEFIQQHLSEMAGPPSMPGKERAASGKGRFYRNMRGSMAARKVSKSAFRPTLVMKGAESTDPGKRLVFGWASVIYKGGKQLLDLQGHMIDADDLEDAAYSFVEKHNKTGEMHQGSDLGELVESLVLTDEKVQAMGLPADYPVRGWWVGFRVTPEVITKVRSGEYKMFSIQGGAVLEPLED